MPREKYWKYRGEHNLPKLADTRLPVWGNGCERYGCRKESVAWREDCMQFYEVCEGHRYEITEPKPDTGDGKYFVSGMPAPCRFRALDLAQKALGMMKGGDKGAALDLWYKERGHVRSNITASKKASFGEEWLSVEDHAFLATAPILARTSGSDAALEDYHVSTERMRNPPPRYRTGYEILVGQRRRESVVLTTIEIDHKPSAWPTSKEEMEGCGK